MVLSLGDFSPRGHLAMSGDTFNCHTWGGRCHWHLVGERPGVLLNILHSTGEAPQQSIIWQKMSSGLRLENPRLARTYPLHCRVSIGDTRTHPSMHAHTCSHVHTLRGWVWVFSTVFPYLRLPAPALLTKAEQGLFGRSVKSLGGVWTTVIRLPL